MQTSISTILFIVLFLWQATGLAYTQAQLDSIRRLGQLNGIALQCKAYAETQRMKRTLVNRLPKRRQLGELFDLETNRSFLQFIENQVRCPTASHLSRQIDQAIERLEGLFEKE
jgi:hypothetical protein